MKFLSPFSISVFLLVAVQIHAQSIPVRIQQAASLISQGNLDEAEAILKPILQQDAMHGPAHFLLGQISMSRRRWAEAEEHLKIALASNLRRPHLAWELLGRLQLIQHRYKEAGASFDESLRQAPDFVSARAGRAQAALFMGDTGAVQGDLAAAADRSPQNAILLAEFLIYSKQDQEALRVLRSTVFRDSAVETAAKSLELAISSEPGAQNRLRSILGENLGDPQVYLALGIHEQRNGIKDKSSFEIAYQIDDQNPMPLLFIKNNGTGVTRTPALLYPEVEDKISSAAQALKANQLDDAFKTVREIIQDRPMHIPAHLIAIEIAEKRQDNWEAIQGYGTIVQMIPRIPPVEARFAALAQKMQAFDLAECRARKAIEVEPENGAHHHLLATILKSKNRIDDALREEELALSFGFENPAAYETLGNLYYQKMEISKAIANLKKAIEQDPHSIQDIASFAISALTSQDHESLRKLLELHVREDPDNVGSLYSLALIYINENRLEEAEQLLLRAEKLAPQQQTYYNLALVQLRLGKTEEGTKAMERFERIKEEQRLDFQKHTEASKIRFQARDAFLNHRMEESIRLYSQLLLQERAETEDLLALARSYSSLKNDADALRIYQTLLRSSPYNVEALAGASQAARATGNNDAAGLYSAHAAFLAETCR